MATVSHVIEARSALKINVRVHLRLLPCVHIILRHGAKQLDSCQTNLYHKSLKLFKFCVCRFVLTLNNKDVSQYIPSVARYTSRLFLQVQVCMSRADSVWHLAASNSCHCSLELGSRKTLRLALLLVCARFVVSFVASTLRFASVLPGIPAVVKTTQRLGPCFVNFLV